MTLGEMLKKGGMDGYKIAILVISTLALLAALIALGRSFSGGGTVGENRADDIFKKVSSEELLKNVEQNIVKSNEKLDLSNQDPQVGGVVEKVSKHILLPSREFTVATVKDAEKLIDSNPVLYRYVKNGQKMVMYDTGIILYDEALDKIVDVIQLYGAYEQKIAPSADSADSKRQ